MDIASGAPVQGPSEEIALTVEHVSEEAAPLLLFLMQELDVLSMMVQEVVAVVPTEVSWRLTLTGDMVASTDRIEGRESGYSTDRGAGTVGGRTLRSDEGVFDIVIDVSAILVFPEGSEQPETPEEFRRGFDDAIASARHLARHEAGHVALISRSEHSDTFDDLEGLSPTASQWRGTIGAYIDDHRIERDTALHAPTPLKMSESIDFELEHLRAALVESQRSWRTDIITARDRTLDALMGFVRLIAYLSAELGVDANGNAVAPDPLPQRWNRYMGDGWWTKWSAAFHRLEPVTTPTATEDLAASLAELAELLGSWLDTIGVRYRIDEHDRESIHWTAAAY